MIIWGWTLSTLEARRRLGNSLCSTGLEGTISRGLTDRVLRRPMLGATRVSVARELNQGKLQDSPSQTASY